MEKNIFLQKQKCYFAKRRIGVITGVEMMIKIVI